MDTIAITWNGGIDSSSIKKAMNEIALSAYESGDVEVLPGIRECQEAVMATELFYLADSSDASTSNTLTARISDEIEKDLGGGINVFVKQPVNIFCIRYNS